MYHHDRSDVQVYVVLGPGHGRSAVRPRRHDYRILRGLGEAERQGDPLDIRRGGDVQGPGYQAAFVTLEEVRGVGVGRCFQVAVVDVGIAVGAIADSIVREPAALRVA